MAHALAVRAGLPIATLALIAGCTQPTDADPLTGQPPPSTPTETQAIAADLVPAADTRLGHFPPFPDEPLPGSVTASLQAVLDQAVAEESFAGRRPLWSWPAREAGRAPREWIGTEAP